MTFEEWTRGFGATPDTNEFKSRIAMVRKGAALRSQDEQLADALAYWMESQGLVQGEGIAAMVLLTARVLAGKIHANMPQGIEASQWVMELLSTSVQVELQKLVKGSGK